MKNYSKLILLIIISSGYVLAQIGVNSAIPYRSWDKINYPNWDFFGFVKNY